MRGDTQITPDWTVVSIYPGARPIALSVSPDALMQYRQTAPPDLQLKTGDTIWLRWDERRGPERVTIGAFKPLPDGWWQIDLIWEKSDA